MTHLRKAYPVVLRKQDDGYLVNIPDLHVSTTGKNIPDSIEKARNLIGTVGVEFLSEIEAVPEPCTEDFERSDEDIITLVDVDFNNFILEA